MPKYAPHLKSALLIISVNNGAYETKGPHEITRLIKDTVGWVILLVDDEIQLVHQGTIATVTGIPIIVPAIVITVDTSPVDDPATAIAANRSTSTVSVVVTTAIINSTINEGVPLFRGRGKVEHVANHRSFRVLSSTTTPRSSA